MILLVCVKFYGYSTTNSKLIVVMKQLLIYSYLAVQIWLPPSQTDVVFCN